MVVKPLKEFRGADQATSITKAIGLAVRQARVPNSAPHLLSQIKFNTEISLWNTPALGALPSGRPVIGPQAEQRHSQSSTNRYRQ
jgi:hypothetical protein